MFRRMGIGALLVPAALALVACGSAAGGGESDTAAPEDASAATQAEPALLDRGGRSQAAAGGEQLSAQAAALPAEQAPVTAQGAVALFLPEDATVTLFGDPIIRGETRPSFGQGWGTNWGVRLVEFTELFPGGPPRDGIRSIDQPVFVSQADASLTYGDSAPVIQIQVNGDIRAYPLDILIWHEIVNDVVGGVPLAVTFCPLCNTAIAYERVLNGATFEFGVSGLLRNSDLVMYDRTTESLWQQIGGKAIIGDMVGARLVAVPAPIVSLGQFRESFPEGIVLSRDTGFVRRYGDNPYVGYDTSTRPFLFSGQVDERLAALERVVTVELGTEQLAYSFGLLAAVGAFNDDRESGPVVVLWTPGTSSALDARDIAQARDVGATGVFRRELDDRILTFVPNDADPDRRTFLDEQTGSTWNIFGQAIAGELSGRSLPALVHANHFWFAWAAFQPDTVLITG